MPLSAISEHMEMSVPYLRCFWFQRVWDFGIFVYIIHSEVRCRGDPSENTEFYNVPCGFYIHSIFNNRIHKTQSYHGAVQIYRILEMSRFWNVFNLEIGDVWFILKFRLLVHFFWKQCRRCLAHWFLGKNKSWTSNTKPPLSWHT